MRECWNFIVKTNKKYLAGILNNLEKMSNVTINYWMDYIRISFSFKIFHKKEKIFKLNRLSKRK